MSPRAVARLRSAGHSTSRRAGPDGDGKRRMGNFFVSVPCARLWPCFGSMSGASLHGRSWPRLRARHTSGLMANNMVATRALIT
jgi:hypothetical protein